MPFDSPDMNLGKVLEEVASGKTQLPDFQREWKWDVDMIRSLLASISLGYPVGVLMMLEVGGDASRFLPRPISGVHLPNGRDPELLILDGQQRVTSLFQSLTAGRPVDTKDPRGKKLSRWYYIDMAMALDPDADHEDAIRDIPEDRLVRENFGREVQSNYSSKQLECEAELFPLSKVFDAAAIFDWHGTYVTLPPIDGESRTDRWNRFYNQVLQNFIGYTIPVIILTKETPKEAVCTVFEKVNTGGVALNVFELLTATFAADGFRLNDDWKRRKERLSQHPVLRSVESTDLLQAVSLLATYARRKDYLEAGNDSERAPGISCKRKEVLNLKLEDYQRWADPVTAALEWAASFFADERIFQASDLPYRTQVVPLSAIRVEVGEPTQGMTKKLRQWYWCGVLGELYGGTTETRFARDFAEVLAWIKGGNQPATIIDANFAPARLLTLKTRNSAAYKGVYALLMREGCVDWIYQQSIDLASFFNHTLDIHHIFPKKWCNDHKIDIDHRESIVNKTAISFSTNRSIGGRAPSEYLPLVQKKAEVASAELDEVLRQHLIDPDLLRSDSFPAYFEHRSQGLLQLISQAMGKDVMPELGGDPSNFEEETPEPDDEDLFSMEVASEPT